jgi:hypothetical protein
MPRDGSTTLSDLIDPHAARCNHVAAGDEAGAAGMVWPMNALAGRKRSACRFCRP